MTQLLLTVAVVIIAGLLSPGPNFVLISGRALSSGSRPAVAAATGVGIGSLTHALFGIAGFGALLRSSTALFTTAKLIGAAYLAWIGCKSLRGAVRSRRSGSGTMSDHETETTIGIRRSALDGYLTQMSNPKSTLFFLAMFTTVVPSDTSLWEGVAVVVTILAVALSGYILIALVFSRPIFQRAYQRVGVFFDALFGVAMIALGVRVAISD